MLDLVYNQEIQKADTKLFIGQKILCRNSVTLGIGFKHGIAILTAVLYYPAVGHGLLFDEKFYPLNQKIAQLKDRYGDDFIDRYIPPRSNCYDVMAELSFPNLSKLKDELTRLRNIFDCRFVCSNSESDFAYQVGSVIPVIGDRPYLLANAEQILSEERCEVSNACKRILSREEPALSALGTALSSLEKQNFYDFSSTYSETKERGLADSYG